MAYIPPKEQMGFVENPVNDEAGKQIANTLGIKYDGIQPGFEDIPDQMQFTDSETHSTTYGKDLAEVKSNIEKLREKFKAKEVINRMVGRNEERKAGESARMKSPHEGWVKVTILDSSDIFARGPRSIITRGGVETYKVRFDEGKHKGEIRDVPANYVQLSESGINVDSPTLHEETVEETIRRVYGK